MLEVMRALFGLSTGVAEEAAGCCVPVALAARKVAPALARKPRRVLEMSMFIQILT
jgi:hypothetical protein